MDTDSISMYTSREVYAYSKTKGAYGMEHPVVQIYYIDEMKRHHDTSSGFYDPRVLEQKERGTMWTTLGMDIVDEYALLEGVYY